MSIEGGGIGAMGGGIGVAVSAAPTFSGISSIGAGIEGGLGGAAPSLADFGPELIIPSSPIVSEGPASLENTMPIQTSVFNPMGEIRFAPQVLPEVGVFNEANTAGSVKTEVPNVFLEAFADEPADKLELVKNEAVVKPAVIEKPAVWFADMAVEPKTIPIAVPYGLERPKPQILVFPGLLEETEAEEAVSAKAGTQPKARNTVSVESRQITSAQPALKEQEIEELTEEIVKVEQRGALEEEEEAVDQKIYLEDEDAAATRRAEIRKAVVEAKTEANRLGLKKIAGWLVAKYLPPEHESNRSQIVKKEGPDGSYQETVTEVARAGEFESVTAAINQFDHIVAHKQPVRVGKYGTQVDLKTVIRVFKYKLVKPIQAYVEVSKRVIKKRLQVVPQQVGSVVGEKKGKSETTLKDLGLAEIFTKAA